MEQAREIVQKPMNEVTETPQLSAKFLDSLKANLAVFGELYRQELTPLAVLAYREALKDMSVKAMNLGFELALKNCKFLPTPAEIREWAGIALAKLPKPSVSAETWNCETCRGTGWKVVARTDGPGEWAKSCDCRRAG